MKDNERSSPEAADKRALAAFVRRVAATVSLKADRDVLLAQAAAIEAEAERIERKHRE
jgi:predicted ATP-grasp superfamily ATP-dependent carboligase